MACASRIVDLHLFCFKVTTNTGKESLDLTLYQISGSTIQSRIFELENKLKPETENVWKTQGILTKNKI